MRNKIFKEFTEEKFNIDNNYKNIISKIGTNNNEYKRSNKNKIVNIAAILIVAIIIGSVTPSINAKIQWNIQFKEYKNREYETGEAFIKEAIDSEYKEEINMEYITQEGISSKVDSLIITDDYLETKISFKFSDDIQLDSKNFTFGFAIYDDDKNIYGVSPRTHIGTNKEYDYYTTYMYKEIGVDYNKNDIYSIQLNDSSKKENINAINRSITSKITMSSIKGFPRSEKLYIRIFDLGYSMTDFRKENDKYEIKEAEDFSLSKSEWIFTINIPEKFYERQTIELKLKEEINGLEIDKITVSDIGLIIQGCIEGLASLEDNSIKEWQKLRNETINITDEEGNIYYEKTIGTVQDGDWFKMNYDINKKMLNKKIYLNVKINGQHYKSELVVK